ncbi:DUF839 domain-containing protein [Thermoleophilia bacterium SCSIO 60948]|nr:DUF839 domain-containing protein [Thermoleophilia bacterium SCSIO 60948]
MTDTGLSRRALIRSGATGAAALTFGPVWLREALASAGPAVPGDSPYGPLGEADANSLELPQGFSSRIVARGGQPVEGTAYPWPVFPDGQATYRTEDGGWILVTNSESVSAAGAGSSAIRFDPDGEVIGAYRILGGTNVNCAGGPTPWGTWLSCEESDTGLVWEADPAGVLAAEPRPALGAFKHEAAAVDPVDGRLYLTEDSADAGFYRFTPESYPSLDAGLLEVAVVGDSGRVRWAEVPDPSTVTSATPTRQQVPEMAKFQNGEGIWYADGVLYFTTKTDKVVWAYDARRRRLERVFDRELATRSSLDAVDNVTVSAAGDVLVCEDGGNMEIGLITPKRTVSPLLRFVGADHEGSEVCGVVFDPSGRRMYCTSQRAFPTGGLPGFGAVYEITGPFRRPRGGVPGHLVFGPPAGERRPQGPLNPGADERRPGARVRVERRVARERLLGRGLVVRVSADEASRVAIVHDTPDLASNPGRGGSTRRPENIVLDLAEAIVERGEGSVRVVLRPAAGSRGRRLLRRGSEAIDSRVMVSVTDAASNERILSERVRVGPRR